MWVVRPAAASDLRAVTPLAGSADRAAARLQAAAGGHDGMLVASGPGGVVGAVSVRWTGGCRPPHPWLYGLHVAAANRREGIGRALVRAAEELARRRGADRMTLDVDVDDTAAIRFYEALGYAAVEPHLHHWRAVDPRTGETTGEGTAPTVIMQAPV